MFLQEVVTSQNKAINLRNRSLKTKRIRNKYKKEFDKLFNYS